MYDTTAHLGDVGDDGGLGILAVRVDHLELVAKVHEGVREHTAHLGSDELSALSPIVSNAYECVASARCGRVGAHLNSTSVAVIAHLDLEAQRSVGKNHELRESAELQDLSSRRNLLNAMRTL